MATRKTMKKFTAMSVWLNVKRELVAANGCQQFFICVRTTTKKRVAELLCAIGSNASLKTLNSFNGLSVNETYPFTPPKDEEIYFQNENMGTPHFREWLSFSEWERT